MKEIQLRKWSGQLLGSANFLLVNERRYSYQFINFVASSYLEMFAHKLR